MAINMVNKQLREFLEKEMATRDFKSQRQFAAFLGVSHTNLQDVMDFQSEVEPSIKFLRKVAKALNIDLCTVIALAYPEDTRISPRSRLLSDEIERLPPDIKQILEDFLAGARLRQSQQRAED